MEDDRNKNGSPQDEKRIDIHDPWQVLWWCRNLGLTKTELESAIRAVGDESVHVTEYVSAAQHKKAP